MLFNSLDFAIFLPIVFLLYWFVAQKNLKLQNALIVLASYVFYGWWDWRFLSLIIFSTVVDYLVGQKLKVEEKQSKRKVLGIDIDIREHNKIEIEKHFLSSRIQMIQGSSISSEIIDQVKSIANNYETILVFLDSNHTYEHVYNELILYSQIVSKNSYLVACDGVMSLVNDTPRGKKDWIIDNPIKAIKKFLKNNDNFVKKFLLTECPYVLL